MLTRRSLLSALCKVPVVALSAIATARADDPGNTITIGPGRYTIAPGGGIKIAGASSCRFERCHIEPAFQTTEKEAGPLS